MENMTKCLLSMLAGALLALEALFGVRQCTERHNPDTVPVVIRDTTIVHDTIRMDNPIPTYIRTTDTIRLKIPVTEVLRDTVYVSLPRETKVYEDSTYKAQISGYEPIILGDSNNRSLLELNEGNCFTLDLRVP